MTRAIGIYTFLLAVLLLLGSCMLEAIEEVGDECPNEDRDTSVLSYIVLPGGKRCHIDSVEAECENYRSFLGNKVCPLDLPKCSKYEDKYFCGERCTSEFTSCAGRCIHPKKDNDFCGADKNCAAYQVCEDESPCTNGVCALKCLLPNVLCKGDCINPQTNASYCGAKISAEGECVDYTVCESSQRCVDGECLTTCRPEQVMCENRCIDPMADKMFCGANGTCDTFVTCKEEEVCGNGQCMSSCPDNQTHCPNGCYNLATSVENCGDCNKTCIAANVQFARCVDSQCQDQVCVDGFKNCDNNLDTGCETEVQSDDKNCGDCGNNCSELANVAISSCTAGKCVILSCEAGFANCDEIVSNGCEVDLATNVTHCGKCGVDCGANGMVGASCNNAVCAYEGCPAGFADCDGMASNGCEINLSNTTVHCGACGKTCLDLLQNVIGAGCSERECTYSSCKANFGDCDGKTSNGCETHLQSSLEHCGKCGKSCLGLPNVSTATCADGACVITSCQPGFGNCDGDVSNGCETNLNTAAHCGTCEKTCLGLSNVNVASCVAGACSITSCKADYGDCDGNVPNGCETSLKTNMAHCGKCGTTCAGLPSVDVAACSNGSCTITSCKAGFGNCDGNVSNGCEVHYGTSAEHCGKCGENCVGVKNVSAKKCDTGACSYTSCLAGFGDCDSNVSNGCETALNTTTNCGTCGKVCATPTNTYGASCNAGVCGYTSCKAGFLDCDGNVANGCEVDAKTTLNCGTCGKVCATPANANGASCNAGVCGYTSCKAGFGDCDSNVANGCETNVKTSTNHCGGCGIKCESGECLNGRCPIETNCPSHLYECLSLPVRCCPTPADCNKPDFQCLMPLI